jgi:putative peptidoglycan lipid II flippase
MALSLHRRTLFTTAIVGLITALVMGLMTGRDLLVAFFFGRSDVADAFFIAVLLPGIAVQVGAAALASAAMPQFIRLRQSQGEAAARRFAESVLALGAAGFVVILAALAAASAPTIHLIAPNFAAAKQQLTLSMYWALLPLILIQGQSTLVSGFVNAEQRFYLAAFAPAMRPLGVILLLLSFRAVAGEYLLTCGLLAGAVLEAAIVMAAARARGLPIVPRWRGLDPAVRRMLRQYGPLALGAVVACGTQLVDQVMAAALDPGSVAAIVYGGKLAGAMIGLTALPLGTVLFPHLALQAGRRDWPALRQTLRFWILLILVATGPVVLLCAAGSTPIVRLLFAHGAFGAADTGAVAAVQAAFVLQVPFYLASILLVRALTALDRGGDVLKIAVTNFVCNLAGNVILIRIFGVPGIALSTSLVYLVTATLALGLVWSALGKAERSLAPAV